jgi:hypothetical protein
MGRRLRRVLWPRVVVREGWERRWVRIAGAWMVTTDPMTRRVVCEYGTHLAQRSAASTVEA